MADGKRYWRKKPLLMVCCASLMLMAACGNQSKTADPASGQTGGAYSGTKVVQTLDQLKEPDYWPTEEWKITTPEEQGMDSVQLASAMDSFKNQNLHSLVVVRNGYIVAEGYNQNNEAGKRQPQYSVTKSVTSALIGQAIAEKKLAGVDTKVKEYVPEFAGDPKKAEMTVEQLLTMTSGLEWNNEREQSSNEMADSSNWTKYVINKPMAAKAGTVHNYSNGNAHLMSMIMQKATGEKLFDYAKSRLFDPMGIRNVAWGEDPQGYTIGAWSLQLTTRDMAKIGMLYLQEGRWEGKQLLPKEWIGASITSYVEQEYVDGTLGGYGYFWWLKPVAKDEGGPLGHDVFFAAGSGGQRIYVVPDYNLIIASTSLNNNDALMPERLLINVVQAVKSGKPLPANEKGTMELKGAVTAFKQMTDRPDL